MKWLADNDFTTLSSAELVAFLDGAYLPPAHSVVLTFDVGASRFGDYTNVVIPALRRYHFRAVFFVLASKVQDTCDGERTCWDSLIQWRDEGLISVESHSLYHQDYTTLTPEQIRWDAGQSKAIIEAHMGQPVVGLCYPFDNPNSAAFSILKDLGYRFTVGGPTRSERSILSGDLDPYNLPRYYPYSGVTTYPAMVGMRGKTFEEMMMEAVARP
jgi:peptidoglycan/xylan/chitin deacetylase (PgdA/CDA1 family)